MQLNLKPYQIVSLCLLNVGFSNCVAIPSAGIEITEQLRKSSLPYWVLQTVLMLSNGTELLFRTLESNLPS